jgi:hypothetical protein
MALKDNIQIRNDSSSNFNTADITLLEGELAFETDTGRTKIGDESTPYSSLTYTDQIGVHYLKSHTVAQANLIKTTSEQGILWVSDETGGASPAYCDGTNWYRFSDGSVIS